MKSHFLAVYVAAILLLPNYSNGVPRVELENSLIYGKTIMFRNFEVNQYLSIPYAEPPVGPFRFEKAVPLREFPPELNAVNVPPACLQYRESPHPTYIRSSYKTEDCLYLNIWVPVDANSQNRKAVMFWIHGGGFRFDSIQNSLYSGVALAAFGDIIVVTVEYRLGLFGFFTSGTKDAPGNAGMSDVLESLRWVKKHIAHFGGDPSQVTIVGESAGSKIIGYLSVSPLAEGLYTRQIMQSGSPVSLQADNNAQNLALAQEIAKEVKCANDTYTITEHPRAIVECVKDVDANELLRAEFKLKPISLSDFLPQFGDEILPDIASKAVFEGNFRCKELFIGDNQDEGALVLVLSHPEVFGFFGEKNTQINQTFGTYLVAEKLKGHPDLQTLIQRNLFTNISEHDYDSIKHQVHATIGYLALLCPNEYYAQKCTEKGVDAYFYYYNHRPSNSPWAPWMGATHFDEVQFVFGRPLLHPEFYQIDEIQFSNEMIRLWTNFVKTGKPDNAWPLYCGKDPVFKYIGMENIEGNREGPYKDICELYLPFFEDISK